MKDRILAALKAKFLFMGMISEKKIFAGKWNYILLPMTLFVNLQQN